MKSGPTQEPPGAFPKDSLGLPRIASLNILATDIKLSFLSTKNHGICKKFTHLARFSLSIAVPTTVS
jgi:hypothetical protein